MNLQSPATHAMSRTPPTVDALRVCSLVLLLAQLSACGGRSEQSTADLGPGSVLTARSLPESPLRAVSSVRSTDQAHVVKAAQRGVLMAGRAGDNAFAALQVFSADDREPVAVSQKSVALTHLPALDATLNLSANVGEVNAALNGAGARIVGMHPGHKTITLELIDSNPPLTNPQAAASLLASRAFQWVQGPGLPVLPAGLTADPAVSEPAENPAPRPPRYRSTTDTPTP